MTIVSRIAFSLSLLLAISLGRIAPLQAQSAPSPRHWTVKLNLISPVWKNVGAEVEYKIGSRLSLLAGAGVNRAFESVPELTGWECMKSRGFGLAAGAKYFLFISEKGKRSVDGIALKSTLNYTFDDEYLQLCPSFAPMPFNRTHAFGLNTFLSAQKTFFDRLVVEAQAGVGVSLERITAKNSELLILYPDVTQLRVVVPMALNVGWTF